MSEPRVNFLYHRTTDYLDLKRTDGSDKPSVHVENFKLKWSQDPDGIAKWAAGLLGVSPEIVTAKMKEVSALPSA